MLPAVRLAASRRVPAARLTLQPISHLSSITRTTATIRRWASSGKKQSGSGRTSSGTIQFKKTGKPTTTTKVVTPAPTSASIPADAPGVEEARRAEEAAEGPTQAAQPVEPVELPRTAEPVELPKTAEPIEQLEPEASAKKSQPLPDLRYGIPSTYEAEYMTTDQASNKSSTQNGLDITDAGAETERPRSSGGAGGEIPKAAYESSIDKRRNKMAKYFFLSAVLLSLGGTAWLGRDWQSEAEAARFPEAPSGWGLQLTYNRIRARLGDQMGYYTEPTFPKLLPNVEGQMMPPYTLVFSLEDFLVHSEWTRENGWRTAKRPGMDFFLLYLSQYFELCLFTSVSMGIADPIVRKLDPYHLIMWPLFREATRYEGGEYVKVSHCPESGRPLLLILNQDLSYLNRPIEKTLLIDTKAGHAKAQPENAIILAPWKGDPADRGLFAIIPFLEYIAIMGVEDVRTVLASFAGKDIPTEFARREEAMRQKYASEIAEAQKHKKKKGGWSLAGMVNSVVKPPGSGQAGEQQSLLDAMAEGKTLFDVMREEGMKRYRIMQKEIKENGARWLKEEEELLKKMEAEQMKHVKKNPLAIFGLGPQAPVIDPQQMMAEAARELAAEKEKSKEVHVQEVLSK